jgi:hypothetical protein
MSLWDKAKTAVSTTYGFKSLGASFTANARVIEYPVKLETEVIGYVSGEFTTKNSAFMKSSVRGTRQTNFRISSDGKVLAGFVDERKDYLPVLNIQHVTQPNKNEFTNKTGLTLKDDAGLSELFGLLTQRANGTFNIRDEALYVTTPAPTNTAMNQGKTNAINESKKIQEIILTAARAQATAAAAAAGPGASGAHEAALVAAYPTDQIDNYAHLNAALESVNTLSTRGQAAGSQLATQEIATIVGLIEKRRAAAASNTGDNEAALTEAYLTDQINTYDLLNAALASVNTLATGQSTGYQLAQQEIANILQIIEQRRKDAITASDAAAADAAALHGAYSASGQVNTDNLINVLTAVKKLATVGQTGIDLIILAPEKEMPLSTFQKMIAFLKSVGITDKICHHEVFDEKTVALLFMVYADRLDVHFIKKRSTVPFRQTTVIGDTHYISRSSKYILRIDYSQIGTTKDALEILHLICLPVSFKIVDTTNTNATLYGFRNRYTEAATLPHGDTTIDLVYPFTMDTRDISEVDLITGRATNRQEAVVASATFTNAPAIDRLTELQELLCYKKPEILDSTVCGNIKTNITNLQKGQGGGRRSRKRMNKRTSSRHRHSRRPGHRHSRRHGHNSRKRYSAGSKSKSGLKSKSASKRRRNQRLQQQQ